MIEATDFVGRVIRAGDTVVYCWRRGSSMGMKTLSVTQVDAVGITGYSHTGRRIVVQNLKNVVVVTLPSPVEAV